MAGEASVAELILKIVADSSEVRKALQESTRDVEKFSKASGQQQKEMASVSSSSSATVQNAMDKSREKVDRLSFSLRNLSRGMTVIGSLMVGSVVGPMVAASKTSQQVELALRKLTDVGKDFSKEIGIAAIPVVEKFTKFLKEMYEKFKALPPEIKETGVKVVLVAGGILLLTGRILSLFNALLKIANLAKIPIIARIFGLTTTVAVGAGAGWFGAQWLEEQINNLNKSEYAVKTWGARIQSWWDGLWNKDKKVMKFDIGDSLTKSNAENREKITSGLPESQRFSSVSNASNAVDLGVIKVTKSVKQLSAAAKEMASGFENGLRDIADKFQFTGETIKQFTVGTVQAMADTFSTGFFDFLTGEFEGFDKYFADFGRRILKMIVDIITQMLIMWALRTMFGGTSLGPIFGAKGPAKHEGGFLSGFGGMIRAHSGLAPSEVPIVAQSGEGVLSRNGMATLGSVENLNKLNAGDGGMGGTQIFLQQTIRAFGPEDIWRERKNLASAMIEELSANGAFRGAIRKYK